MAKTVHIQVVTGKLEYHYAVKARSLHAYIDPLPPKAHAQLVARLANLVGKGEIQTAARLAFVVTMAHPIYGYRAQNSYCEACHAFDKVVVSVALTPDGLGVAIGDYAVADRLHAQLEQGERGEGADGPWPVWH